MSNTDFLTLATKENTRGLPVTPVVQSRPQTAPRKQHWYFRQDAETCRAFGGRNSKEIHVADLNAEPDAKGNYPSYFDLKGIGGGGFVVAEGSYRADTGEVYTGN